MALWKILRKSSVLEKFQLFSVLADKSQAPQYCHLSPKLKKIFDLRNRLAHFKDEDIKIADQIRSDEFLEFISTVEDPDLMKELKGTQVIGYSTVILETHRWLRKFLFRRAHRYNIKISSQKNRGNKS